MPMRPLPARARPTVISAPASATRPLVIGIGAAYSVGSVTRIWKRAISCTGSGGSETGLSAVAGPSTQPAGGVNETPVPVSAKT